MDGSRVASSRLDTNVPETNAATRRCEMASPGVCFRALFFVVYFLTLKRVKISESTEMLREVAPVLRRTNNMSRIEPA